jgi:hypothetical protein
MTALNLFRWVAFCLVSGFLAALLILHTARGAQKAKLNFQSMTSNFET